MQPNPHSKTKFQDLDNISYCSLSWINQNNLNGKNLTNYGTNK